MGIWGVSTDRLVVRPYSAAGFRSPAVDSRLVASLSLDRRPAFSNKSCLSISWPKIGIRSENHRAKSLQVKALENSNEGQTPIAPLQFESPTGQLLSQIMQTHPHLLPATIDQQLERLQSDQDTQKKEASPASQDHLLYRRIAEVKDKERRKALEEIIYCLVVYKFMENDISMIPAILPSTSPSDQVYAWPSRGHKLEAIHSPDALEIVQSYLSLILGGRLSKLKLGILYAASILYGYFLRRVDQRFQLERSMKTLPTATKGQKVFDNLKPKPPNPLWYLESMVQISSGYDDFDRKESNSCGLMSYIMYLDAEILQRYANIRSKESVSLMEKQTQALFGRLDIRIAEDGSPDASNDAVSISFTWRKMLILEAVAYGSFLWEAESYAESKYHFFTS